MSCALNPYTLPTIEFIGGTSMPFVFRTYFRDGGRPFDLSMYDAVFSVISYVNKNGAPLISLPMTKTESTLRVTIPPSATKNLVGKYIYQIMINGESDESEACQGVFYIHNNIDKVRVGGS